MNRYNVKYIGRVLHTFSMLLNVILGGELNQTFSARNYQRKRENKKNVCFLIDILFYYDTDHCMLSWTHWKLWSSKGEHFITGHETKLRN
jgi:hypothetical protein